MPAGICTRNWWQPRSVRPSGSLASSGCAPSRRYRSRRCCVMRWPRSQPACPRRRPGSPHPQPHSGPPWSRYPAMPSSRAAEQGGIPMTTDVVIAGGGPNGLLLACELALAGVRPVVLERLPERATAPKANGLVGRVVQALDYRGLYGRFGGSSGPPVPVPGFQFGALPLDLSALDSHALYALPIPQRRMEELLEEDARELGAQIRRGHELAALRQTADLVTIDVQG